ncbi:MAG: major facilitator superfamily 1 [Panacagrimonas sp.]|jgi:MFS family permease|nr:MFS transporter [Panacagrimonas sp.]MCC2657162.1 major facilitator superfamily 1 [Panacagrimonas sp.]
MTAGAASVTPTEPVPSRSEQRRVIFASSLGTVFEWYDFYLYATLAPFFAALFFPKGNETAALMSAFATYAAGFLVRPFGALVFGRLGDLVGRKYTFLVTIVVMGGATAAVGFLPTYEQIGIAAPIILVSLRLLQGLALGGEYGGAATYVAEHAPDDRRGYATSWIQTTATLGFFLSLLIIGGCRVSMDKDTFADWGWRVPFLVSIVLLVFSVYIRMKLNESPLFQKMKAEGRTSKSPLTDSFLRYPNNKFVALALFGAVAGQGVVWYTGQFYALFFLTITLKLDYLSAYGLIAVALLIGTPFFVVFGSLSDRIGRLKIILAGCLLAVLTYFPIFKGLTHAVNPALESFQQRTPISVSASGCNFHIFVTPGTAFSDCDRAKDFLTKAGLSFESKPAQAEARVVTRIGDIQLQGWDEPAYKEALKAAGYPTEADRSQVNYPLALGLLLVLMLYVTMVYGPIAAWLVELFPTRIRYTSMSLPYHIGNGWFGGMLPLLVTAMAAAAGDIYAGLWYPIGVALMTLVVGVLFLRGTDRRSLEA